MVDRYHALVLNFHQPAGNLEHLLQYNERQAKEILYALDRVPRSLWNYDDIARAQLCLSGTLLETLANPEFQRRVYGIVDCGSLLWYLQNSRIIQILGSAYYHPLLPLTPRLDWEDQLQRASNLGRYLFPDNSFAGFWPPNMAFCMELIPLLKQLGYRYVLVDSEQVDPITPMSWETLCYRPHVAQYGNEEIIVVVRDHGLSKAQEIGFTTDWFLQAVQERTQACDFPALITTCTDGENGHWFRNTTSGGNFWSGFYQKLLDKARDGTGAVVPTYITEYLDQHGAYGKVHVRSGSWNSERYETDELLLWSGSRVQTDAFVRALELTQAIFAARANASSTGAYNPQVYQKLEEARWHVLRAETSCNFFWGETWVNRCHQDLDAAVQCLEQSRQLAA